jgi:CheY-like chemotaxis protein
MTVSILVVEDEHPIRDVITEILEDEGYRVVAATNGLEALTYLREHAHPRLILLDLGMPIMTGWEFREHQQRDPRLANIPVVVMSALPDLYRKAAALNVADCLDKPVNLDTLLGTVARYVSAEDGSS